MKTLDDLWVCLGKFSWISILLLPVIVTAQPRTEELKRCLGDFGGIEWKLPYRPPIHIRACVSQSATYDTGEKSVDGRRSLELIGELTLGPDANLSSDETYAALQSATFTHFDALFRRHGYRLAAVEHGDARTKYYANTMRMLRRQPRSPEAGDESPALPPIPYISLARYVRAVPGKDVTLTYKTDMKNTWIITIEGLPVASGTAGAAR